MELRLVGLNSLGIAWRDAGQVDKSVAAYNEALALLEKHSVRRDYAAQLHKNLGIAFATQKKPDVANAQFIESLRIEIGNLASDLPGMIDQSKYTTINSGYVMITNSIHTLSFANPSDSGAHGLQAALWTKSLYSEVSRREQPMLHRAQRSGKRALVAEYLELRRRVSKRVLEYSDDGGAAGEAQQLTELANRLREVELTLRRDPEVYRKEYRFEMMPVESVRARLSPGDVLLEYVVFEPPNSPFSKKGEARYGAYVMVGGQEQTWAIPLGPAAVIDDAILDYRDTHESQQFYDANDENILRERGEAVRKLLFDPIFASTEGIKRLYVAPDGLIGLLPFEVLPSSSESQRYLVEETQIVYITTGRDLASQKSRGADKSRKAAWIVGDPAYNATEQQRIANFERAASGTIGEPSDKQLTVGASISGWERLPYTREAVRSISAVTKKA
jgi:tetratricopeptide (TPR) repeat protein